MTDTPNLRNRQKQMTRQLIMDAYADLSLERGFNNFTMQDIADATGVSHRTLYRYFDNRDAILDEIAFEVTSQVQSPDDLGFPPKGLLVHNYSVFGRYRKAMRLISLMREAGMVDEGGRDNRTQYVTEAVDRSFPHLSQIRRRQLVGLARLIAGGISWVRLTSDDVGLSDEEAGEAAEWALQVLFEAARNDEGDAK